MFPDGMPGGMWLLHILFCLLFLIGLVLFIVWLVQFLMKKKSLLTWAITLLVIGVIGMFLTFQFIGFGMMRSWNKGDFQGMYQYMLDDEHSDFSTPEEFREHMIEEMEEDMGL